MLETSACRHDTQKLDLSQHHNRNSIVTLQYFAETEGISYTREIFLNTIDLATSKATSFAGLAITILFNHCSHSYLYPNTSGFIIVWMILDTYCVCGSVGIL